MRRTRGPAAAVARLVKLHPESGWYWDFTGPDETPERELPQDRIARIAERLAPLMATLDKWTGLRVESKKPEP